MHVLRLAFEGIGPFTRRHEIDFAALGAGGLFLLEGPTGAGKTTIIDALVFALYGDVAGVDSSKARLVSTQLPPGVEPYVDATVETARGLYRVRRVPQHTRRKARGAGTTVGKASIKLWRLASPSDEGTLLSTSMAEASEELQRSLGLTKEQFTQTVVLPQGHFATFLRAKPEDRRGVLQDIFGTEFYARCARELAERAAAFRAQEAEWRAALDRASSSFALVAWGDASEREAFAAADDPVGVATGRFAALAAAAAEASRVAEVAAEASRVAEEALRAATDRNETLAQFGQLQRRLAELDEASAAIAEARRELQAAERAEHVRHPLEALAVARSALHQAKADAARGLAQAAEGPDADLAADDVDPGWLAAVGVEAREQRSALVQLVELESGLGGRAQTQQRALRSLADRRADADKLREGIRADREAAAGLRPEFDELLAAAQTRAECLAAQSQAQGQLADVRRLETLAEEFLQARAVEQGDRARAQSAVEAHQEARAAWLSGLAGTLAGELTPGGECPVCGSRKHPAPARRPDGAADRAEVERLEQVSRRAEQEYAAAQARSDGLATAMSDQQAVVGDLTRIEAEVALAEAVERTRLSELAATRAGEVRDRIEALIASAEEREERLHRAERQLAADTAMHRERAERLDADRARVQSELGEYASLADRSEALRRRAEWAARLSTLLIQERAGADEVARRAAELATVLDEQGFADADEARAALRDASVRQHLRDAVEQHASTLARVRGLVADERFAGLDAAALDSGALVAIDVQPLREASEGARAALQRAQQASGSAASLAELATGAAAELRRCTVGLADAAEQGAPYLAMADLANGTGANQWAVTLPTFVLLRRFEEVVDFANVRLDAMTGGRYSLRRTDAREGRSHKLGLGLEVVDHVSGDAARDPKTLSGGETFQTSLALALGLADAVTAEAGGIELNTLFVDEGFGALDAEALDMVMNQLTALRDGGRCVGVVSHVAELKQRIAERISVISRRDGTSTLACSTDVQPALAG